MHDRDWLFIFAMGVVLCAGLLVAGVINYSNERTRHYEAAKKQYHNAYQPIVEPETYRQAWRAEQDLEAQRDMAKWAWLMMLASFAGLSITTVGVVFVAQTLIATRDAVAAANRTADEAKRIGEAQVRAYLAIDSATIEIASMGEAVKFLAPRFHFKISNFGNSPARNLKFGFQTLYLHKGGDGMIRGIPGHLPSKPCVNVTPQESVSVDRSFVAGHLSAADKEAFMSGVSGNLIIYAVITIQFTDVFDAVITEEHHFTAKLIRGVTRHVTRASQSVDTLREVAANYERRKAEL